MSENPRQGKIAIAWLHNGELGRLTIGGEHWVDVEWSEKRQQWCIQDCEGRCLTHAPSIRGKAASKEEAVALAEAMIRDGRMPDPETARTEAKEHRRAAQEKRDRRPSEQRRKAEREAEREASNLRWEIEAKERDAQPLYETLDEAFDLGDPELWKSNSFAALKPRLILHIEANIAELVSTVAYEKRHGGRRGTLHRESEAKLDRAKAIYCKLTGVEWAPRPSKTSQILAQIEAHTAKQEAGLGAMPPDDELISAGPIPDDCF